MSRIKIFMYNFVFFFLLMLYKLTTSSKALDGLVCYMKMLFTSLVIQLGIRRY